MNQIDLNQFYAWVEEKPESRSVEIKINPFCEKEVVKVWAWNRDLMEGMFTTSVDQINIEEKHEAAELRKLEELQAKYNKKSPAQTEETKENLQPQSNTVWEPEAILRQEG